MRAADLIRRKRDGGELEPEEMHDLIQGYTEGSVGEEQMAAFCMAVWFQGMGDAELSALVQAMLHSGEVLSFPELPGPKIDKHSTGGVGDKISICLAPLVAACGVIVPMISGRGLGHTGGTLDKLSAIPGFRTDLDVRTIRRVVAEQGLVLAGQTAQLAPADRALYALRDVTSTVESVPLIAASIMSKKLAEGIDGLVLDVKVGSGAFMKTLWEAERLARALIVIGARAGKRVSALLTDMDRVLGRAVGNANETWEALEVLRGGGPADVRSLTLALGAEMLLQAEVETDLEEAEKRLERALDRGDGFERLSAVVAAQGGDPRALESRDRLPTAPHTDTVHFEAEGYVQAVDVEAVGRAAMVLGAGRARSDDRIDPAVGLEMLATVGDRVQPGDRMAKIEHREGRGRDEARRLVRGAFRLGSDPVERGPLVLGRMERGFIG